MGNEDKNNARVKQSKWHNFFVYAEVAAAAVADATRVTRRFTPIFSRARAVQNAKCFLGT